MNKSRKSDSDDNSAISSGKTEADSIGIPDIIFWIGVIANTVSCSLLAIGFLVMGLSLVFANVVNGLVFIILAIGIVFLGCAIHGLLRYMFYDKFVLPRFTLIAYERIRSKFSPDHK